MRINNWNESRKAIEDENKLLHSLHEEFGSNLHSMDQILLELDTSIASLTRVLKIMDGSTDEVYHGRKLDSLFFRCLDNSPWNRSEFTLKDLESSGRLSSLNNDSLKILLYRWSQQNASILERDDKSRTAYEYFLKYIKEHRVLRQLDVFGNLQEGVSILQRDNDYLLKDILFENAVDDFLVYTIQRKIRYIQARELLIEIILKSGPQSNLQ